MSMKVTSKSQNIAYIAYSTKKQRLKLLQFTNTQAKMHFVVER